MKYCNKILNVKIENSAYEEVAKKILTQGGVVVTPNIDHIVRLQNSKRFYGFYKKCNHVLCDSRFVRNLIFLFKREKTRVFPGSEFFPDFIINNSKRHDLKVFLLGGETQEDVEEAQARLNRKINSSVVVGAYSPVFGFEKNSEQLRTLIELINVSGANVLAVGIGSPKQEFLIEDISKKLENVKIYFAIGATVNFLAGRERRAPKFISFIGMEWLFRFIISPKKKFYRYFVRNPKFLFYFVLDLFGCYKDPFEEKL